MEKPKPLNANLYNKNYYLKTLPGLEHLEKMDVIDPAVTDTIRFGHIVPENHVLDFGCGRGALAIALAKRGSTVVGVDFSQDAINFASEYLKRFPEEVGRRVRFFRMEMSELNFKAEFDAIVFNQVYEHLHNWELEILLSKFKHSLKQNGILVISTPNLNYIRYLFPLKRIADFPFKVIKEIFRVIRGKSKHASSLKAFFKEIFKICYPESEHTRLHVNLQTPRSIRNFLETHGWRIQVECVDLHTNLMSLAARRWWGETIWCSCQPA